MAKCTRCGRSVLKVDADGLCTYCASIENNEVETKQAEKEQAQAEKAQARAEKLLKKYNLENIHDAGDLASLRKITGELAGTGFLETGMTFDFGSTPTSERLQVYYQRAILEQNWIIIRQLDRISASLEKLLEK